MNSQHYITMRILSRTTNSLEDALESLDTDGPNLSITESGKELPYYSKLYITPADIEGYFEINCQNMKLKSLYSRITKNKLNFY